VRIYVSVIMSITIDALKHYSIRLFHICVVGVYDILFVCVCSYVYACVTRYPWKKSLKIPKGQSESVYRGRTDNAMAKRKRTKGQTTIYKTYI
jgi:hypothetical protein